MLNVRFGLKIEWEEEKIFSIRKNIFYLKNVFRISRHQKHIVSCCNNEQLVQRNIHSYSCHWIPEGATYSLIANQVIFYHLPRQRRNILKVDVRYDDIYSGMTEMKWWFTQLQNLQVHSVICKSDLNSDLSFSSYLCSSAVQCRAQVWNIGSNCN